MMVLDIQLPRCLMFILYRITNMLKQIKQLIENPKNIYVVGGFGVDLLKKQSY